MVTARTYRLRGCPGAFVFSDPGGYVTLQWCINEELVGVSTNYDSDNATGSICPTFGTCEYIYENNTESTVVASLRITDNNNLIQIGYGNNLPWVEIQVIGGNAPVTLVNTFLVDASNNLSYTLGNVLIGNTAPSTSTSSGALQVSGGVGIEGNLNIGGILTTYGDISCNGNINIKFPINTTYAALPSFTNTQVGNILANIYTSSQFINNGNSVYPFNILYNITPGIWIANYTAYIATSTNVGAGNITFGMSTIAPVFTGTNMNVFPLDLGSSYGVQKIPIISTANTISVATGPIILSGTAVIPFTTTGTISMVGNINGFVDNGNAVTRSVLTATRIA